MLVTYISGHGFGHLMRTLEVLRTLQTIASGLPIAIVGAVPEDRVRRALAGPVTVRAYPVDVGLVQRDALRIDEAATVERCRAFEATWDERVAIEAAFLRSCGARAVLGDIPPLAFAAAAASGLPSIALGNFSWDWIYRHLGARHAPLLATAERAARSYRGADVLLELPFAGDLSVFRARHRIGFIARRPRLERGEARRLLGLDGRVAALVSFGGVGLQALPAEVLRQHREIQFVFPDEIDRRIGALGMEYPDVVGAVDVIVTKPGYGIVSDAIGAGTRIVYTERGDFPEYEIMVRDMPRWLACVHVSNEELLAGRIAEPILRVMSQPMPPPPDLDGARRAASHLCDALAA